MLEEISFIEAIRSNRADDTARLVYADWLDENGGESKAGYLRKVVALCQSSASVDLNAPEWIQAREAEEGLSADWLAMVLRPYLLALNTVEPSQKAGAIKGLRQLPSIGGFSIGAAKVVVETLPAAIMVSHSLREIEEFYQLLTVPGVELRVYHSSVEDDFRGRYFYPVLTPWPIGLVGIDEDQEILADTLTSLLGPGVLDRFVNTRQNNQEVLIRMPVTYHKLVLLQQALASRPGADRASPPNIPYRFVEATPAPRLTGKKLPR
jgi:uncharacterized protein (TIGR02996 family)